MNNITGGESKQIFPPSRKRQRNKLYAILFSSSLLILLIAVAVLLAWPSSSERFRRDLLDAIEENDRQRYFEAKDYLQFNGNEKMYDFRNKEEQLAVKEAQRRIFHIWLDDDKILWDDEELERKTVGGEIYLSGSYGTRLAESDEGFELVKKAIEKLEEKYPLSPSSKRIIIRDKDGKVGVGIRQYSHRTQPR